MIPSMNVVRQYESIREELDQAALEVLHSGSYILGESVERFQTEFADYCGTKYAIGVGNGTDALVIALRACGVKAGDEVITTAMSFFSTAESIAAVGAIPVFVDCTSDTYLMDTAQIEEKITEKTKAVIPVDLAGIVCDYNRIFEILERKKNLFRPTNEIQRKIGRVAVVADGAHAFGAVREGKKCGEIADFTSFSFHAVKNLTTAEGGAVVWRDIDGIDNEELYKQFMLFSLHGQSKDALAKTQLGAWEYDIVEPYFKCNMTDIMASIGLAQLERYPKILARRREIIQRYDESFVGENIEHLHHYGKDFSSSGHLYITHVLGKNREECNEIIRKMAEKGIATNVHYKPLPMLTAYKKLGFDIQDYPNAYRMFSNEITLPLHTKLTNEEVEYVIKSFKECIR